MRIKHVNGRDYYVFLMITFFPAVVLFERDRATNQSKIVVVKAPLGNPNNIKDTSSSSSSPFSPLWGDMDNDDSDDGDCLTANEFLKRSMSDQSAAAAAAAMPGTTAPIGQF